MSAFDKLMKRDFAGFPSYGRGRSDDDSTSDIKEQREDTNEDRLLRRSIIVNKNKALLPKIFRSKKRIINASKDNNFINSLKTTFEDGKEIVDKIDQLSDIISTDLEKADTEKLEKFAGMQKSLETNKKFIEALGAGMDEPSKSMFNALVELVANSRSERLNKMLSRYDDSTDDYKDNPIMKEAMDKYSQLPKDDQDKLKKSGVVSDKVDSLAKENETKSTPEKKESSTEDKSGVKPVEDDKYYVIEKDTKIVHTATPYDSKEDAQKAIKDQSKYAVNKGTTVKNKKDLKKAAFSKLMNKNFSIWSVQQEIIDSHPQIVDCSIENNGGMPELTIKWKKDYSGETATVKASPYMGSETIEESDNLTDNMALKWEDWTEKRLERFKNKIEKAFMENDDNQSPHKFFEPESNKEKEESSSKSSTDKPKFVDVQVKSEADLTKLGENLGKACHGDNYDEAIMKDVVAHSKDVVGEDLNARAAWLKGVYRGAFHEFTKMVKGLNKMKDEKKMSNFSKLMARNFGDDDNSGDTQNIDGIDREAVFQAGMSIAHEIFGDDTDEKIVWSMVDSAIDKAMKQDGDTQVAIGILKGMYTKNESFTKIQLSDSKKIYKRFNNFSLNNKSFLDALKKEIIDIPEEFNEDDPTFERYNKLIKDGYKMFYYRGVEDGPAFERLGGTSDEFDDILRKFDSVIYDNIKNKKILNKEKGRSYSGANVENTEGTCDIFGYKCYFIEDYSAEDFSFYVKKSDFDKLFKDIEKAMD